MPRIQKQKVAIGYLQIEKTSTPRDIGNPAKARVDTLKWMKKGEGPVPELQLCAQIRDDDEVVDHFLENTLRHPESLTDIGEFGTRFLFEVEEAQKELMRHSQANLRSRLRRTLKGGLLAVGRLRIPTS